MTSQRARVAALAAGLLSLAVAVPGEAESQVRRDSVTEARARAESVSRATSRQRDSSLRAALSEVARAQESVARERQAGIMRATAELERLEQELLALRMRLDAVVTRMASDPSRRMMLTDSLVQVARRSMLVNSRIEAMRRGLQYEMRVQHFTMVPKGWLGVNFEGGLVEETPAGAVLWATDYPRVFAVVPGSPAEQAGLTRGDRIMTIAGRDVRTNAIMLDQVFRPGGTVSMLVERGGRPQVVSVRVTERPSSAVFPDAAPPAPRAPDAPRASTQQQVTAFAPAAPLPYGVVIRGDTAIVSNAQSFSGRFWPATITTPEFRVRTNSPAAPAAIPSITDVPPPQSITVEGLGGATVALRSSELAYAFGARLTTVSAMLAQELSAADGGVLVLDVAPGTPASRAGLRPLDVLVRANGQPLQNPQALIRLVRSAEGQVLELQIVRRGERASARLAW